MRIYEEAHYQTGVLRKRNFYEYILEKNYQSKKQEEVEAPFCIF